MQIVLPEYSLLPGGDALRCWSSCCTCSVLLTGYIVVRQPSVKAVLLALAHVYAFGAGVGTLHVPRVEGLDHSSTNMVPLFLVMGWIITRRFARSLTDAELLKARLEQRVEHKRMELASHAGQVRWAERRRVRVRSLPTASARIA